MIRRSILFFIVLFITRILVPSALFSQEITDPEAEFAKVRELAFSGDYVAAAADARKLVNSFPSYGDARILLGRILAWQKDFANAEAVIDTLLKSEPDNSDALSVKRDILLWSKDNTPMSTGIRTGYSFDSFGQPYDRYWQIYNAGAEHRFKWGPAAASVNIGNLAGHYPSVISATEFQFEAEAYPKLSSKNYAYLDYAYSPGKYFPGHRAAVEIWQILNAGWAISAGLNYYYFERNYFIASASIEKYTGKYWLSLKSFIYFKDHGPTMSGYFSARRYFKGNNFLQLTSGAGTAPDEPFDIQTDLMRLSAYTTRLVFNLALKSEVSMRAGTGYSYEEFLENRWRNRFEGNISFIFTINKK